MLLLLIIYLVMKKNEINKKSKLFDGEYKFKLHRVQKMVKIKKLVMENLKLKMDN